MVKLLLKKGVQVDLQDGLGRSALMHASWEGHGEVVRLLLEKGAQVDLQDGDGLSSLALASRNGHVEVAQLLQKSDLVDVMEHKLPLLEKLPVSVVDDLYPGIVFSTLSASVHITSAGATIDRLHDMGIAISVPEGAIGSDESFDLHIRCGILLFPVS